MKTVILCGGRGTRFNEYTQEMPKPLIKIGEKPILWHLMKYYSDFGFNDFILCTGYLGEKIKEYFTENNSENWNLEFVDTGQETNTGGRVKKIEEFIEEENFFCTYADGLADIDLNKLLEFHLQEKKVATITAVKPLSQFGVLEINDSNEIQSFKEKPLLDFFINGGFFVFKKEIFNYLNDESVLEKEPFEKLAAEKQITAFKHSGFWKCMDTFKDMLEFKDLIEKEKAAWVR